MAEDEYGMPVRREFFQAFEQEIEFRRWEWLAVGVEDKFRGAAEASQP